MTLYRDLNYTGLSQLFTGDVPDLRSSTVGNDSVTSLKVRCESLAKATKTRS